MYCINGYYETKNKNDNSRTAKFSGIQNNIEIANVGTSHTLYGFNYDDLENKYKCFNFSLESQTLSYSYRVLEEYIDYMQEDGILFVEISYFNLYGKSETEKDGFEAKNQRYYKILSPRRIKEYSLVEDLKYGVFPILSDDNVLRTLIKGKETDLAYKEVWYKDASKEDDLKTIAYQTYERHFITNDNIIETKQINSEEIDAVKKIISLCKERKVTPILIVTPLLNEYKELIDDTFLDDFNKNICEIVEEMQVEYYDYSSDERLINDKSLFLDCDHLNHKGALEFTNILCEDIIQKKFS